jgi:hypothetical protein
MRATSRLPRLTAAVFSSWMVLAATAALAQTAPQTPADPGVVADDDLTGVVADDDLTGVVADDDLTVVVGTRFVAPSSEGLTAKAQFTDARIPLSAFNETDHCVDQQALEMAKDYFNSLGRLLGKAAQYYFVPDADVKKLVSLCEKQHGRPPQAWVDDKTRIIAFGFAVPTAAAPALERSIR